MTMAVTYGTLAGQTVYEERGGTERVYVPDTLGSTAMLTDLSGSVTDTFRHWAYGEERVRTGTTATPFRFVGTLGYYRDAAARLYVRARTYFAGLARWASVDPLWPVQGAYGYVGARPASAADPSGMMVVVGVLPCNPADCSAAGNACVLSVCFRNGVPTPGPACDAAASAHYDSCGKPGGPRPPGPPGSWWPNPFPPPGGGGVFPPNPNPNPCPPSGPPRPSCQDCRIGFQLCTSKYDPFGVCGTGQPGLDALCLTLTAPCLADLARCVAENLAGGCPAMG